ncbi:retrovirus-related pol polyprotein from transposon TNT 1-94, partial [Tanacetum coccineum]
LIRNHGHKESGCIVGERKMEFTFFSKLIMVHSSLEPPETHLEPHLKAVFFLDQKDLAIMMILMIMTRNDSMLMSVQPTLSFKVYPKTSTSSSITTLKQNLSGTMSKCFLRDLSSPKKTENLSCMMNLNISRCFLEKTSMSIIVTLPQTNNQLRTSSNTRNQATVQDGRVVVQNVQGRQNQNQRNFVRGAGAAGNRGAHNRAGNANVGQGKPIKCYNCSGLGHIARNSTQPKRPHNSDFFKDKMLLMQA